VAALREMVTAGNEKYGHLKAEFGNQLEKYQRLLEEKRAIENGLEGTIKGLKAGIDSKQN
jgi:hypothetical protein